MQRHKRTIIVGQPFVLKGGICSPINLGNGKVFVALEVVLYENKVSSLSIRVVFCQVLRGLLKGMGIAKHKNTFTSKGVHAKTSKGRVLTTAKGINGKRLVVFVMPSIVVRHWLIGNGRVSLGSQVPNSIKQRIGSLVLERNFLVLSKSVHSPKGTTLYISLGVLGGKMKRCKSPIINRS